VQLKSTTDARPTNVPGQGPSQINALSMIAPHVASMRGDEAPMATRHVAQRPPRTK